MFGGFIVGIFIIIAILSIFGVIVLPIAGVVLGIAFVMAILGLIFDVIKVVFSVPALIIIVILAIVYKNKKYY